MTRRRATRKACIVLTALSFAGPVGWGEEDGRFEMWEEPSHQQVFVNGPVRILDVRVVPGATSEFHKHRYATTYVIIQDALVANQLWDRDWSPSGPRDYREPGRTADQSGYVANPFYHRVRNEDQKTFHVVAVINERALHPAETTESQSGAPIDNPWFREHRLTLAPSTDSDSLKFTNDTVLVQPVAGSSHVVEGGIAHGFKGSPGAYSWHPARTEFAIANRSPTALEFVLLEVKSSN